MNRKPELPQIAIASVEEWERWLEKNHDRSSGLWLKIAKAGSGFTTVSYQEAIEVALCYGWIDGQKAKLDSRYWLQRFTPRKPDSAWSKINREKALLLIEQGRMKPSGAASIEAAKAHGTWERAYDSQKTAEVPADLNRELEANPKAARFFADLDSVNRYAILYRIHNAKRPETRSARIAKFIAMLNASEKIHEGGRSGPKGAAAKEGPGRPKRSPPRREA